MIDRTDIDKAQLRADAERLREVRDFYRGNATYKHDLELGCAPTCPCQFTSVERSVKEGNLANPDNWLAVLDELDRLRAALADAEQRNQQLQAENERLRKALVEPSTSRQASEREAIRTELIHDGFVAEVKLSLARAEVAALRDAIAAFFEVDDETAPMDYGDHTGMTWEDAGKRAQAEDNLRAALGTGTAGDGQ